MVQIKTRSAIKQKTTNIYNLGFQKKLAEIRTIVSNFKNIFSDTETKPYVNSWQSIELEVDW